MRLTSTSRDKVRSRGGEALTEPVEGFCGYPLNLKCEVGLEVTCMTPRSLYSQNLLHLTNSLWLHKNEVEVERQWQPKYI